MSINNTAPALPTAAAPKTAIPAAPTAAPVTGAPAPEAVETTQAPVGPVDTAKVEQGPESSLSLPESGIPESSSSVEAEKVKGKKVTSIGDPHETTGDGMKFDNMETGVFVKMRSKAGDFELQTRQDPWEKNAQTTVNTAAAIKLNGQGDIFGIDANGSLSFNGKAVEVKEGEPFEVPGGGKVEKTKDGYTLTSAAGDVVNVLDRGTYLDVAAEAGPERRDGDITGSLGALDSDTDFRNDLVGRDGQQIDDVAKFIDEWRVKDGESLIPEAKGAKKPGDEKVVGGTKPGGKPAQPEDELTTLLKKLTELLEKRAGKQPEANKPEVKQPEQPKAPKTEAPKAEQPKTEAPKVEAPKGHQGTANTTDAELIALLNQLLANLDKDENKQAA